MVQKVPNRWTFRTDVKSCVEIFQIGPLIALPATAKVVRTNREHPPDFINIKVEELVGDRPFDDLNKYITQTELRALSDDYKRVAGFAVADVNRQGQPG